MTGWYQVTVQLGSLTWDVVYDVTTADPEADEVLDGLSFGWTMPDGLWPQQPDPMSASLAINVPDFTAGIAELVEGDVCAITVGVIEPVDTTPQFRFYGRITDLKAVPRNNRTGVTLSVVAVDNTIDLAEKLQWAPLTDVGWNVHTFLEEIWDDNSLGAFPTWSGAITSPITPDLNPQKLSDLIAHELQQTVLYTPDESVPSFRLILAPNIDPATNAPDITQPWSFDVLYKFPYWDPADLPACYIETDSLEWLYAKTNEPNIIQLTGDGFMVTANTGTARRYGSIETTLSDSDDGQDVADFYLPADDPSWRINTFRYHLTGQDPEDLDALPPYLFPLWLDGTDPTDRAGCYGRAVHLTGIPGHRQPYSDAPDHDRTVKGRLTGARVNVTGGRVFLDMQLRQTGTSS